MQLQTRKSNQPITSPYLIRQGELEASPATKDPILRLGAAIVENAVHDLGSPNLLRALDALLWLSTEGILWLRAIGGFDQVSSEDIFEAIGNGRIYAKRSGSSSRYLAQRAPGHGRGPKK